MNVNERSFWKCSNRLKSSCYPMLSLSDVSCSKSGMFRLLLGRVAPEDKIALVKARQAAFQGKSRARLRRSGESNPLTRRRGVETCSPIHRVIWENYFRRSVNALRSEQVVLLATLYRE